MNPCGSKLNQQDFCRNSDLKTALLLLVPAGAVAMVIRPDCWRLRSSVKISAFSINCRTALTSAHLSITHRASPGRRDHMTD